MSDNKIYCEKCGKSFNPGSYVHHACFVNASKPATQMLTRKLQDKMAKKRKAIPNDIARDGTFPQTESVSVEEQIGQIRTEIYWLKEAHKPHIEMVKAAVKSALKSKRLKGKHRAFYAKKYAEEAVQS